MISDMVGNIFRVLYYMKLLVVIFLILVVVGLSVYGSWAKLEPLASLDLEDYTAAKSNIQVDSNIVGNLQANTYSTSTSVPRS